MSKDVTPNAVSTKKRLTTTAVLVVGGGAITLATWVGGQPSLALVIGGIYVVASVAAFIWAGRSTDVAAMLRAQSDERQRFIESTAITVAAGVTALFCVGGAVVDLARGNDGDPWISICAVAGVSYAIAIAVLRRRV